MPIISADIRCDAASAQSLKPTTVNVLLQRITCILRPFARFVLTKNAPHPGTRKPVDDQKADRAKNDQNQPRAAASFTDPPI